MQRFFALVPAAGVGSRFGATIPKQYCLLGGKPLIDHTLLALSRCESIEQVWVVLSPDDQLWETFDHAGLGEKIRVLRCGGDTRAASVLNGLREIESEMNSSDWVMVHDAARPCLSLSLLNRFCAELANDPVGGLLAVPVADTLKRSNLQNRGECTVDRTNLWQAQTPQMFRYELLFHALQACSSVTDEASAVEAAGYEPKLVMSDIRNFKVTLASDLHLAELILKDLS